MVAASLALAASATTAWGCPTRLEPSTELRRSLHVTSTYARTCIFSFLVMDTPLCYCGQNTCATFFWHKQHHASLNRKTVPLTFSFWPEEVRQRVNKTYTYFASGLAVTSVAAYAATRATSLMRVMATRPLVVSCVMNTYLSDRATCTCV